MSKLQIPGPEVGLNELIDAFTLQKQEENAKKEKYNPLRPSAAGKCEKELGYEFEEFRGFAAHEREPMSAPTVRLLDLGHHIERAAISNMYDAFGEMDFPIKIRYKQQVLSISKLPDGTYLEGSMDLGIEGKGWKMLIDWKSKGDKYSQFFKSSWDEFIEKLTETGHAVKFGEDAVYITDLEKFLEAYNDPWFSANLFQLNLYADSDFLKDRDFNLCSIMQYNKNDSRIREIRFVPSSRVAAETKAKFERVQRTVDTDKSAANLTKEYVLGSSKCAFCNFKKKCWPEDDALKAFFAQLPAKQWPKDVDRLPAKARGPLELLFEEYHALENAPDELEKVEEKICGLLEKEGVFKIRLSNGRIYRMKKLKSGGAGGGERLVLRRDKL